MRVYTVISANELKEDMVLSKLEREGCIKQGDHTYVSTEDGVDVDVKSTELIEEFKSIGKDGLVIINSVYGDGTADAHIVNAAGVINVSNYINSLLVAPDKRDNSLSIIIEDMVGKNGLEGLITLLGMNTIYNLTSMDKESSMLGMGYIPEDDGYITAIIAGGISNINDIKTCDESMGVIIDGMLSCDMNYIKGYATAYDKFVSGMANTMSLKMCDSMTDGLSFLIEEYGYNMKLIKSREDQDLTVNNMMKDMFSLLEDIYIHKDRLANIGTDAGRGSSHSVMNFEFAKPLEDNVWYVDHKPKYVS